MNETENGIISFDEGVDATYRGYNYSMNFWYVAGEVYFSAEAQLPQIEEGFDLILTVMAKSPVNEWVNTELRIRQAGTDGSEKPAVLRSEQVNTQEKAISFDLTEYAGQSVQLEFAYAWDQASLLTIVPRSPAAELQIVAHMESPEVTEEPVIETPAPVENTAEPTPVIQESIEVPEPTSAPVPERTQGGTMILPAVAVFAIVVWIGIKKALKK